jgi:hypothetical protein
MEKKDKKRDKSGKRASKSPEENRKLKHAKIKPHGIDDVSNE